MKLILKIFVPVFIFVLTLGGLLLIWNHFRPVMESPNNNRHKWFEISPGDRNKLPGMYDLVNYPGSITRHKITNKFGNVSDAIYRLNNFGIRDEIEVDRPKRAHLLLAGCSFTFGDNLPFEETFPAILRKKMPEMNVRNLGFPGGGLHSALRHFEISDFREFAPEKKGIYAYIYISDHYNRWARSSSYLRWARVHSPTYDTIDGKLTFAGPLRDHPEYKRYHFLQSLGLTLPEKGAFNVQKKPDNEKLRAFLDGIVLLRERYLKLYPEGRFIWIVHPLIRFAPAVEKILKDVAKKRGIEIMYGYNDYREYLKTNKITEDSHLIRWDGHPNGEFNKWYAGWLHKKLSEGTVKR